MDSQQAAPPEIRDVLRQGLLKRLPLTFVPFTNQQIHQWDYLFEYERRYLLRTLTYLSSLDPQRFDALFRGVREVEARMNLESGPFSLDAQTMQSSSWLARSPYYTQWRREVEKAFRQIDRESAEQTAPEKPVNRLLLVALPARLPLDAATVWSRWQGMGSEFTLDLLSKGSTIEALFKENTGQPSLATALRQRSLRPDDVWLIDADNRLGSALGPPAAGAPQPIALSYERLKSFREGFLERINAIQKDLADADAVYARLRQLDLGDWCPPNIASRPPVREFLRSLFLSGNGALVFSNSFVEWACSEIMRRARPSVLAACFGTRMRPKPFTSLAIFENQERASPVPSVEDLPASALDAEVLAYYTVLAARRSPEYRERTVYLGVADALPRAYLAAPAEFPLKPGIEPVKPEQLSVALGAWLA